MHKLAAAYIIATSRTQFLLLILKPEKQEKVWKKKLCKIPLSIVLEFGHKSRSKACVHSKACVFNDHVPSPGTSDMYKLNLDFIDFSWHIF